MIDWDSLLITLTGKSTLMRQTGLLMILAKIWCMVPAAESRGNIKLDLNLTSGVTFSIPGLVF